MKLITTILLLICFNANATIYYVSNTGSDAANGTSTGTPWQTILKVNSSSFSAGDQVLFKKGDTWNERLNPPSSGSVGNVITFGSYGSGLKPIISGFQTLSGWTNDGNIWSSTFSNSAPYQNTVYISGALRAKGRYPNNNYLTFTSHSGKNQITGGLSGSPDYTGGEIAINNAHFIIDHLFITSQSGGTINFSPGVYYNLIDNYGYFIQNHPSVLDTLNEWCYDTTTKIIKVYSTSQPDVKASAIDTLFNIIGKNYITIDGIRFEGANVAGVQVSTSNNITIINCDFVNMGTNGIEGKLSNFLTVSYCSFINCWNDAIKMIDMTTALSDSHDAVISYNTIANTGTKAGMGSNRWHAYTAVTMFGDRSRINNNTITNTGYIGVYFYGDTCIVKNNYVDSFCSVKDDGGGLYTYSGIATKKVGGIIRSNIVMNGFIAPGTSGQLMTFGIFIDNESSYVTIDSNLVYNIGRIGIFTHESYNITIKDNILFSSKTQFAVDNNYHGHSTAHIIFKNNTLVSQEVDLIYYSLFAANKLTFDSSDNNHFYCQYDSNKVTIINVPQSLSGWQNISSLDLNSTRKPLNATSARPLLRYNRTSQPVTLQLSGTYISSMGRYYTNAIHLLPFQSVLLYKATTDIIYGNPYIPGKIHRQLKFKNMKLR